MVYCNTKYIIKKRGVDQAKTARACNIHPKWISRFTRCGTKYVNSKAFEKLYVLCQYLDVYPADLLFMSHQEFISKYQDDDVKEYKILQDCFLYNLKLYLNNDEKNVLKNRICYEYRFIYNDKILIRNRINRYLRGSTNYNLDDIIKCAKALQIKPQLLMFGVQ